VLGSFSGIPDWVGIITGISAAIGALWVGGKKFMAAIRYIISIARVLKRVEEELTPNGGKSMKDAIDRIERQLIVVGGGQIALLQDLTYGVYRCDQKGDTEYVNRTLLSVTGMQFEQVVGTGWLQFVSERDRDAVDADWKAAVREGREFLATYDIKTVTGEHPVVSHAYPIKDEYGVLVGYFGTIKPVDGRNLYELGTVYENE